MSKSPNLFLPAAGGAALMLGVAYGVATNNFADDKVSVMERQVEMARTEASDAVAAAEAEAARVADIEAKAAEIQNEARLALASAGSGPVAEPAPIASARYGLGRPAHDAEIAAWDVDVLPDGRGLPDGSGDAFTGEEVFEEQCAVCHGSFAEGVDNWPKLAGGFDTLADEDPLKTVGSYWPYLSTVWDYVNRSMPFGNAQSLSEDEVYSIVAYILYSNDIIDDEFVLSKETFLDVEMPNAEGFYVDDRETTEYAAWRVEPCMENCKDSIEITMRASVLDVTPEEEMAEGAGEDHAAAAVEDAPAAAPAAAEEEAPVVEAAADAFDPALVAAGDQVFKKCKSCHQVGAGAKNRSGPQLNHILDRPIGSAEKFKYSKVMAGNGGVWDNETLTAFLANPKKAMKGTKMSFAGLKKPEDIEAVIAYIQANSE